MPCLFNSFLIRKRKIGIFFSKISIIGERVFNKRSGESTTIIQLLESVNMVETVNKPKSFVAAIVYEF